MQLVRTKHGHKARMITQAQEDALDHMVAHPSSYPHITGINVLNESFNGALYVYCGVGIQHIYLIAQDGAVVRVA